MSKERSVVVTGGSGFIGSNVCKTFVESGWNVINIDKRKREMEGVTQYPFEVDNKQVQGILKLIKPDVVIHTAANNSVPDSLINTRVTYTDNVYATISLLITVLMQELRTLYLHQAVVCTEQVYMKMGPLKRQTQRHQSIRMAEPK